MTDKRQEFPSICNTYVMD